MVIVFNKRIIRTNFYMDSKDMKIGDCYPQLLAIIHHTFYTFYKKSEYAVFENATTTLQEVVDYMVFAIDFLDRHLVYSHCFIIILPFSELGRLFECMFL